MNNIPTYTYGEAPNKIDIERLRDEFAMAALTGMVQSEYADKVSAMQWSKDAYEVADAMLKAREIKNEPK